MVEELAPEEVSHRLAEAPGKIVLLDVREDWERAQASIEPSLHIPMQQVAERLGELPRDVPIVVYCHGGARSAMVAGFLASRGFARVSNLSGGVDAWSLKVDPKVPRY
ncbi:MAG TPA: rhodanese-like domain-containing protein [Thermoplasmata archaeon]|nr:rhodanese-like domain-containing protein [Thermoplasmata archaeon]